MLLSTNVVGTQDNKTEIWISYWCTWRTNLLFWTLITCNLLNIYSNWDPLVLRELTNQVKLRFLLLCYPIKPFTMHSMLCSGHQSTATTKKYVQQAKKKRKTKEKRRKSQEKNPLLVNKQQQNKKKTKSKQKGYSTIGTDRVSLKFTQSVPMVEFTKVH